MTRRAGALVALLAVGLLLAVIPFGHAAASGSTWYVGPVNCSDTGPGTPSNPFCHLSKGAATATHLGDTVHVLAGTYTGPMTFAASGAAGAPITFAADPGVLINAGSNGIVASSKSYVVINGFSVTGTTGYGISVSGGSNVTVSNNTVTAAGLPISGKIKAGIYLSAVTSSLVSGNVSHDNSDHGISVVSSSTGVVVRGNTSYHNANQYHRNAAGINVTATTTKTRASTSTRVATARWSPSMSPTTMVTTASTTIMSPVAASSATPSSATAPRASTSRAQVAITRSPTTWPWTMLSLW
jgi:parallel beta-helix repeat protein